MVASCTTFDSDPPPADAAVEEASAADAPVGSEGGPDGEQPVDGGRLPALQPVCPAPAGGTGSPAAWQLRKLFVAPASAKMFPFAIATDATHVTWLAQVATSANPNPYDGVGEADVLRVPKDGAGVAVTLAHGQRFARALALDGIYAYWVAHVGNVPTLLRVERDCAVGCAAPQAVMVFPASDPIARLARATPGILFATSDGGKLFRIDVDAPAPELVFAAADNAGLAVTSASAYVSANNLNAVARAPVVGGAGSVLAVVPAPEVDGGVKGLVPIATDCNSLWAVREHSMPQVLVLPLSNPAMSFKYLTSRLTIGAFDLVADAKYLYSGAANAGGLFVIDKTTGANSHLAGTNVWRIAVDDDGVYFGEHDPNTDTGTITMLVKN